MFCWSALLWPRFTNATSSPRLFWSSIENKIWEGTLASHLFTKTTILCLPWSLWLPHPWGSWPGLQYQAWLSFEEGLKSNRKANWLPPHQSSLWAPPLFPKNAVKCVSLKQTAVWVFLNVCGHLKCICKNRFEYRESLHHPQMSFSTRAMPPIPWLNITDNAGNGIPIEQQPARWTKSASLPCGPQHPVKTCPRWISSQWLLSLFEMWFLFETLSHWDVRISAREKRLS